MPRRNPESFPEQVQVTVFNLSNLVGLEVKEYAWETGDENLAKAFMRMVYAYCTALEGYTKTSLEQQYKNRVISSNFKRNYGMRQRGSQLMFVPKTAWFDGKSMDGLNAIINHSRSQLFERDPEAVMRIPDVGIKPPPEKPLPVELVSQVAPGPEFNYMGEGSKGPVVQEARTLEVRVKSRLQQHKEYQETRSAWLLRCREADKNGIARPPKPTELDLWEAEALAVEQQGVDKASEPARMNVDAGNPPASIPTK